MRRKTTEPRRRGSPWLLLLGLALISIGWWQCSDDEAPVAAEPSTPSEPTPVPVNVEPPSQQPGSSPPIDAGAADAGSVTDAGPAMTDAGVSSMREPTPLQLEAYMKKWREALEPLMRRGAPPSPVKAIVAEAKESKPPPCEPGLRTLELLQHRSIDHVVAVDTSGSMYGPGLKAAAEWIGRLEFGLVQSGREYRIVVLAEPRVLKLGDAGIAPRSIGSHDGLDVLLQSAVDELPRWLSLTREGSELRLLLITDDSSAARSSQHSFARMKEIMATRRHTFSVIGGFALPPDKLLLSSAEGVSQGTCRPLRRTQDPYGFDPGVLYQEVAIQTGGTRASLCSEPSRNGLVDVMIAEGAGEFTCAWSLGDDARVVDARAIGKARSDYLVREYSLTQCQNTRRSYLLEPPELALCPDTCTTLKQEGFEQLQVRVSCER